MIIVRRTDGPQRGAAHLASPQTENSRGLVQEPCGILNSEMNQL